jgi:GNAT superfamily N-acetyltransferase/DNA-binding HxlR family transcriptional regulator
MDHFDAVGALGLGSRFKRLSDTFMADVKSAYLREGYAFEPRWFPVFSYLARQSSTTVSEVAAALRITHPHVSQIAKELENHKLISLKENVNDGRSRIMRLTTKGQNLAKIVSPLWGDIKSATQKLIDSVDPDFLMKLEKLEKELERTSHDTRIIQEKRLRILNDTKVLSYTAKCKADFIELNKEWIEEWFDLESHDHRYFEHPEREIIQKGGAIIFAEVNGEIVGTCSLLLDDGAYELAKLAVTKSYKGLGIGKKLCEEIIELARSKGAKQLSLTTNSRLRPAIELYKKLGFVETMRGQHPKYKRVDLVMEKHL